MFMFAGVDPGSAGGIAVLVCNSSGLVQEAFTKSLWNLTLPQTWELIHALEVTDKVITVQAVLEKVQGYTGQSPTTGSSMFSFGASFGGLRAFLVAASVPYQEVVPQVWQRALGMRRNEGESKTHWKNRLKDKAASIFPQVKMTLAIADALLMAEFARRRCFGVVPSPGTRKGKVKKRD